MIKDILLLLRIFWSENKIVCIAIIGVALFFGIPYITIDGATNSCDGRTLTSFSTNVSLLQLIFTEIDIKSNCVWEI